MITILIILLVLTGLGVLAKLAEILSKKKGSREINLERGRMKRRFRK